MPELPEVETVRQVLKKELIGKTITKIDLNYKPIFENEDKLSKLIGQKYEDILRKGKYLIFCFNNGYLLSHLRMEGKYFYVPNEYEINKHMHVVIYLNNNYKLIYQDVRKFGRMHYYDDLNELYDDLKLGPDANEEGINLDELYNKMLKSKLPLKTLLLDQSFIAGLGNIYVDEVLYSARLMPNMPANLANKEDLINILKNAKQILNEAIINKGTTIRSYTSSLGVEGNYQNHLQVHTKEKCPLGHHITTIKIGGRTTYFCPVCQNRKKLVLGLTGSIATGKSNVLSTLKTYGFKTCDSDMLVREAYCDPKIKELVYLEFNTLDKKEIANIIYQDKLKKAKLESIIHPYVINKLKEACNSNGIIILDIPLLFEAKLEYLVDKIICCYLPYEEEIKRLMNRDKISKENAKMIIANQIDIEQKKIRSDYVIDTSSTFAKTNENINKVIKEIMYGIYA